MQKSAFCLIPLVLSPTTFVYTLDSATLSQCAHELLYLRLYIVDDLG